MPGKQHMEGTRPHSSLAATSGGEAADAYGALARRSPAAEHRDLLESELVRIVRELVQLRARKVVLFGSYARAKEAADLFTDLDILAVLDSDLPFVERTRDLYRRLAPRVATDILAYTPREWENVKHRPFIEKALAEGKVLHEETSY